MFYKIYSYRRTPQKALGSTISLFLPIHLGMAILEGVLCHECLNYIEAKGKLEDILHFKGIIILRHSIVDECRKQKRELKLSRWVCSWQEDDKIVTKYLESCAKMSKPKAPTAD